jgi:GNAT superfamily N-acetyltransferase
MGLKFIDCPPERIPSLRAFFSAMYWPGYVLSDNESFLRWQFGPTPLSHSDNYHLILGVVDDQIKGCLGYIPVEVSLAGRRISSAWAANWMVDESTRRLGLGPLLMRELSKRFDITLALGGNRDAHDLLPRMGWTDFGLLPRYVSVLDPERAALLTEHNRLEWPSAPPSMPTPCNGASVARVDAFGDDTTRLWDETWGASAAGTRRSAEFLNWRYAAHPTFTHHLFEVHDHGRLRGMAVLRIEQVRDMPIRVGRVLELLGDDEHIPVLLASVVEDARTEAAAVVDFFCGSRRMARPLEAAGFLPGERPPASSIPILFQPVDRTRTGILFMANLQKTPAAEGIQDWYVTKSDGDQDRPS